MGQKDLLQPQPACQDCFPSKVDANGGRSVSERAGAVGPCLAQGHLVQPDPRPVAARAILFHAVVHWTSGGGALHRGLVARGEEVTVTPGCLKRLEEWAQKPGLMQASVRLQRAPAWLPSMPGWVAAASADQELAADACLDTARRELPPPPHRTVTASA